ncbi:alkylsulfatase-like [Saccoglossus kowalevskii]
MGSLRSMFCRHAMCRKFIIICCAVVNMVQSHEFYDLKPVKLGCEIRGIDIGNPIPEEVIEQIKKDVTEHRLLIFKDQHNISPNGHVRIGRWFGDLESSFFTQHPKSPLRDIYRVSNDGSEGLRAIGTTSWHSDCLYLPKFCSYSIFHVINVSKEAETDFVPLNEIVEGLSESQLSKWEKLWLVVIRKEVRVDHPLIYSHPESNKKVLSLPTGFVKAFAWDTGDGTKFLSDREGSTEIRNEILSVLKRRLEDLKYPHMWEVGDFIIADNQAVAHWAPPSSQKPRTEVGLRVLHRVTVAGKEAPERKYDSFKEKDEL